MPPPPGKLSDLYRPQVEASPQTKRSLARMEKWAIAFAIVGTLALVPLAIYTVSITTVELTRNGILEPKEASYWARSGRLVGLSLGEAQQLIDAPLRQHPPASGDAVAIVAGLTQALQLTTRNGRVEKAEVIDAPPELLSEAPPSLAPQQTP